MIKALLSALVLVTFLFSTNSLVKRADSFSRDDIVKTSDKIIPDQYIVVYKDTVSSPDQITADLEKTLSLRIKFSFNNVIKGYSAVIAKDKLDKIKKDPRVAFVTQDREITILMPLIPLNSSIPTLNKPAQIINPIQSLLPTSANSPTPTNTPLPTATRTPTPQPTLVLEKQTIPSGVSRIGLNATNEGAGVGVAILDTGVDLTHPDLSINLIANKSCVDGVGSGNDDQGHGTQVAGIVAALNNSEGVIGVAPQAKIIAVKVLSSKGSGSYSSLLCGIDWITENAKKYNIKVANLSLGATGQSDNDCGKTNDDALHFAICKSRNEGITYIAAAGNSGENTSSTIPAAYDDAVITVSALGDSDGQPGGYGYNTWDGKDDTFASFSNFGYEIDLGAPGIDILSTKMGGSYSKMNGTSFAAPHVAGAAAMYFKINPDAKWNEVKEDLISVGEPLRSGHSDPSRLHPEKVVKTNSL